MATVSTYSLEGVYQYPEEFIATAQNMISTHTLADALRAGEDYMTDVTGQVTLEVDQVIADIGTNISTATINTAFVDSLASSLDPAGATSIFNSFISARLGQMTSQISNFADMCITILSSSGSVIDKLNTFFSSMIPSTDDDQPVGFTSITYECTGASPASLFMDSIDTSDIGNAIVSGVTKAAKVIGNFWKGMFKGAKKLASKAVSAIEKFTTDTLDISTHDEYGDYSFEEGFIRVPTYYNSGFITSTDFNEHRGEYLLIPVLGGCLYINSSDGSIIMKPHMYSYGSAVSIAKQLISVCTQISDTAENDLINIADAIDNYSSVIAAAAQNVVPFDVKLTEDEAPLYAGFLLSKAIFCCSLILLRNDDSLESSVGENNIFDVIATLLSNVINTLESKNPANWVSYNGSGSFYESHPILFLCEWLFRVNREALTIFSSGNVTNLDWLKQVAYDSSYNEPVQSSALAYLSTSIVNYIQAAVLTPSDEIFLPYQWRTGQISGRYSVKSDAENAVAFRNFLIAVTVIVVIAVAAYFGIRHRGKIKIKALQAQRDLNNAWSNPDIELKDLKKLQKKSNRLNKMAGITFPDTAPVASLPQFSIEEQVQDHSTKFLDVYSQLDEIKRTIR